PGASHIPASGRGERFAALEPARLQDVLAARRRHPGPKPVDTAPVSLFGLERSLHGEGPPGRTLYSLPTARLAGSGLIQSADGTISGCGLIQSADGTISGCGLIQSAGGTISESGLRVIPSAPAARAGFGPSIGRPGRHRGSA